jgi:hypothetical protein
VVVVVMVMVVVVVVCYFVVLTWCTDRGMDQFMVAMMGNLQHLRAALRNVNVEDVNSSGWTVLHCATYKGHFDCVEYCIEFGANVNARNNDGWLPLHLASLNRHVDIVRILLDAGAIVDATNNFGWTPLCRAIVDKHDDLVRILIDRGAKVSNILDKQFCAIPDWVTTFIQSRSKCRFAAILIIDIHKYHRTNMTGNNDINVIKLISKHIWSMRMNWTTPT